MLGFIIFLIVICPTLNNLDINLILNPYFISSGSVTGRGPTRLISPLRMLKI